VKIFGAVVVQRRKLKTSALQNRFNPFFFYFDDGLDD